MLIGVVLDLVERAGVPIPISELRQLTTIVMAAMVVAPTPAAFELVATIAEVTGRTAPE